MIKGIFKLILLILLFGFISISPKTRYLVGITLKEISSFLLWTVKFRGLGDLGTRGKGKFLHRDFEDSSFPNSNN